MRWSLLEVNAYETLKQRRRLHRQQSHEQWDNSRIITGDISPVTIILPQTMVTVAFP
jgi:hypothetical protein